MMEPLERNPDGTPKGYPCCDRKFPDPDPMFRFIDPDEGPGSFWEPPYDERSRRARAYLLLKASGCSELEAWVHATDFNPEIIAACHVLVDVANADDRHVVEVIERGARDRLMRDMMLRTPAAEDG